MHHLSPAWGCSTYLILQGGGGSGVWGVEEEQWGGAPHRDARAAWRWRQARGGRAGRCRPRAADHTSRPCAAHHPPFTLPPPQPPTCKPRCPTWWGFRSGGPSSCAAWPPPRGTARAACPQTAAGSPPRSCRFERGGGNRFESLLRGEKWSSAVPNRRGSRVDFEATLWAVQAGGAGVVRRWMRRRRQACQVGQAAAPPPVAPGGRLLLLARLLNLRLGLYDCGEFESMVTYGRHGASVSSGKPRDTWQHTAVRVPTPAWLATGTQRW